MSILKAIKGFPGHLGEIAVTCGHALYNKEVVHFPRVKGKNDNSKPPTNAEVMQEIAEELDDLEEMHGDISRVLDLTRSSLDEQIAQTNHQDDKNTKLLTIVSFLSAAAGAFFAKYIDMYPIHDATYKDSIGNWYWLVLGAYIAFALFAMAASLGALVSFYAIRTRFYWDHPTTDLADDREPRSRLFFRNITTIRPAKWAQTFIKYVNTPIPETDLNKSGPINKDAGIALAYFKDYVAETYFVAVKVAEKVRLVEHAQWLLGWSINLLVALLFLIASSFIVITPFKAPPACCTASGGSSPTGVETSKGPAPTPAIPLANSIVVNCTPAQSAPAGGVVNNTKTVNSKNNINSTHTTTNSTINNTDAKPSNCPK